MADDLVQEMQKKTKLPPKRYFDQLYRSVNGVPVTDDNIANDHNILSRAVRNGAENEAQLAQLCGADVNTDDWRDSMHRLTTFGYLVVINRGWDGIKQAWIELDREDRKLAVTATGIYFGNQLLSQLLI